MIFGKLNISKGRAAFLFLVVSAYGLLYLWDPHRGAEAMRTSVDLSISMIPSLFAVFILMAVTASFLDTNRVRKLVGTGAGLRGWLLAVSGGVLSSGPIYLWYPLLADLRERGMGDGFTAAFLSARAVKLPLLPVMAFAFGWGFTIGFSLLLLLFSFFGGIATERIVAEWDDAR